MSYFLLSFVHDHWPLLEIRIEEMHTCLYAYLVSDILHVCLHLQVHSLLTLQICCLPRMSNVLSSSAHDFKSAHEVVISVLRHKLKARMVWFPVILMQRTNNQVVRCYDRMLADHKWYPPTYYVLL